LALKLRKWLVLCLLAAVAVVILSIFVHPSGPVKRHGSRAPLLSGALIDAQTLHIISTSCQNCHSERTDWPWYSYVAPASWLIESDVHRARSHMNFSRWAEYPTYQRMALLSAMQNMVQTHMMPLPRYLWLHPDAKLSAADINRLSNWVQRESNRLQSISAPNASSKASEVPAPGTAERP
jgi:hypothetical protein